MKIIQKGTAEQPIQEMDELTFICSCGCEYKASIKEGEAKLDSISPYPILSTLPIVYVYSSVCPSCGAVSLYRGEPVNYCCCAPDAVDLGELQEKLNKGNYSSAYPLGKDQFESTGSVDFK